MTAEHRSRPLSQMNTETWNDVVGYEGLYEVSDLGNVRSLICGLPKRPAVPRKRPRLLRPSLSGERPSVGLRRDGGRVHFSVYRLVLEAFVGPCPEGMEACHWDGNSLNSRLGNLRWGTKLENMEDNRRNGVRMGQPPRSGHALARLTEDDIRCIRAEPYFPGVYRMLGRCFAIGSRHIRDIRAGKYWREPISGAGR